jgi:excisionase family DNA binding protein
VLNSRKGTAAALSLGIRTVDQLIQNGKLQVVRVGRRVLVPRAAIEAFARGIQTASLQERPETTPRSAKEEL